MRSQELRVPHSNPMMRTLFSPPTLPATGSIAPLHALLQASSRVIVNKPPRVFHRYQLDLPSNRYEFDPLVQNQSLARRVMLAQQSPSQLLQLHLVGNVLPQFLPPLLLGYLLWDLSPISEIYRCIDEIIEIVNVIAQAKPVTMDSESSIGHQIVEASSP